MIVKYLVIWYVSALHVAWGICVLCDYRAAKIVGMDLMARMTVNPIFLGLVCLLVGSLAFFGTLAPVTRFQVFYQTPQQLFLLLSASSSLRCVLRGMYADGVPRPPLFILADQIPSILILVFYSWAAYFAYRRAEISRLAATELKENASLRTSARG